MSTTWRSRLGRAALAAALALGLAACAAPGGPTPGAALDEAPGALPGGSSGGSGRPLVVVVGDARLEGRGEPPGSVRLAALDGTERGSAGVTDWDGAAWTTTLRDARGDEAPPRPGDAILFRTDDSTETLRLPPLRTTFDVALGRVAGRTAPGARVAVDAAADVLRARAETTADAAGDFAVVLEPAGALAANHPVTVAVASAGLTMVVPRRVPYARVSTHPGDLTGYAAPLAPLAATLLGPDGAARGRAEIDTDGAGRFDGWLRAPDGTRVRPRPGDVVRLDDADGAREVAVAPLGIAPDLAAGVLAGDGAPGDAIQITLWNPWRPAAVEDLAGTVDERGRWSLATRHGLPPATHFYVTERGARGDETFHCYQVPKLHVEPGSPVVGVEALWDVAAELEVVRDGRIVARAAGGGMWATDVELVLRAPDGAMLALAPGDRVEGTLDGRPVALDVPALSAALALDDAPRSGASDARVRIEGAGPPGAVVGLASASPLGLTATVAADGRYALAVAPEDLGWATDEDAPLAVAPGTQRQVVLELAGGHAARARLIGPSLEVALFGTTATGRAAPGLEVVVEHARDDGAAPSVRSDATTADPTGAFTLTLAQAAVPTDRLVLRVGGRAALTTTLPVVAAAWGVGRGRLEGSGPADSVLDVAVWYGDEARPERLAAVMRSGARDFELRLPAPGARRAVVAWEAPGVRVTREASGP